MTYIFDIDGTICSQTEGDYSKAIPFKNRIKKINSLYDEGHTIIYHTARGMGRTRNNVILSYKLFYEYTSAQLAKWGVKYHDLFMGKPNGGIYIDDKGVSDVTFYTN